MHEIVDLSSLLIVPARMKIRPTTRVAGIKIDRNSNICGIF